MTFIVLRRSRNTRNYYLVESYRDGQGKTKRRTLCYLGREQDGTDTLAKAQAHWEKVRGQARRELRKAGGERRQVIRRRIEAAGGRLAVIAAHLEHLARAEAERKRREQQAEEMVHWQCFERLRRQPSEENAKAARRAFLLLAKRHHPDSGGTHQGFLRYPRPGITQVMESQPICWASWQSSSSQPSGPGILLHNLRGAPTRQGCPDDALARVGRCGRSRLT